MDNTENYAWQNCSCRGMKCQAEHRERERMFTFELAWPKGHALHGIGEEIDVYAATAKQAAAHGKAIAVEGYAKGAMLVEMSPGGSGGYFQQVRF